MMRTLLALPLALVACNAPSVTGVTAAETVTGTAGAPAVGTEDGPGGAPETAPTLAPDGWREGTVAALSNDGSYRVHYRPVAGPIERGEPFALEVWVLDPSSERPLADVALDVDAAMPEHEHGMNREPRVTPDCNAGQIGTGAFEVEGMLFHMLGRWELYLDVTRGAITERAQFEVLLE